ncbi:cyclin-like protein [Podospora aff. communis PSN243]|uniref:Cyclin-like protein n=1 Tax=Podospora aff. communis PSN243 TaxID=3040156 RepID=A0AAV9GXP7_9PEZI|nr:cyclin-like protein [Podospora aff. communis PSN243]
MTVAGSLNAPPRRTAFGDVSNTARTFGDIGGKNGLKNPVKSVIAAINSRDTRAQDKENNPAPVEESWARSTAASRASLVASKHQNVGPVATGTTSQVTKPALRSYSSSIQPSTASLIQPTTKPAVSKKATMVYFDKKETDVSVRRDVGSSADEPATLIEKPIKNPRHYKSQPQLKTDQPVLRRTQSRYINKCEKISDVEYEIDLPDDVTEAAYEDAVEQFPKDVSTSAHDALAEFAEASKQAPSVEFASEAQVALVPAPAPATNSEAEEYWDEDDEQELYDEQGYTTAHSYRSHGDNTTQGVTTLVAPKVTAGIERELEMAKAIVLENLSEEEVEEEAWDVSMVAEYGDEIFTYMRQLESSMIPNPYYMDIQTEIQWSMRSVLMDWLVQVHHRFGLLPETLFLTVNYIDRFLSVKIVSLNKLQLVGATAIFVAAKYEEINCPSVQEIVYMVDSGYTVEEILKAERFMLSMLQFELGWPGPMSFLRRISKADDYDLETRTLAKYFLEVTIMDERFVGSPPSYLAAGAHCLSRLMLKKGDWTAAHVHYSGYTMAQLRPLISMIFECCQDGVKHHSAVYEKYSSHKYKKASTYVEGEIRKGFQPSFSSSQGLLRSGHTFDDSLDGHSAELCHVGN